MLTCFSYDAVNVPVPAKENAHGSEKRQRRRWTGEIKRKILAATRWPRIWAVREEEPCDVDVEEQRAQAPEPKFPEPQATPRREGARAPSLQSDRSPSDDGAPEAMAVAVDGRRKRKGLRVRFDLPPQEISAAPPVEPRFPTGVLGEPPESFARSGADMTAAFLMSVIAEKSRGMYSATQVDRDLVACWTERKAACSRRLSYLRDYCPFQREEEEAEDDEDEESEPETTTRPEAAEPGHAEVRPVKAGLPLDSPESEAEFVKAIRSRYLRKDDFLFRPAYERSREQQSLMAAGEVNIVHELKV
jgi:hypothetical protein